MTRRGWTLTIAAAIGVGLLAWTVASVGLRELTRQLNAIAPVLPLILCLAGARFLHQAAGWRLALAPTQRPLWGEAFAAVVAGEAAGYFAWGPVSREPMKALLVEHRVPQRAGLAAAVVERTAYSIVATALIATSLGIMAIRFERIGWLAAGLLGALALAVAGRERIRAVFRRLAIGRRATTGILAAAAGQELLNLVEAYVVLTWLGASPTVASVIVLEGIGRLLNSVGQFIPGKLGISEAATAAIADVLKLGASHGLTLALARRIRSLAWGAAGIAVVTVRAAQSRVQPAAA